MKTIFVFVTAFLATVSTGISQMFMVDTTIILQRQIVNIGRYNVDDVSLPQMVQAEQINNENYLKFPIIQEYAFQDFYNELLALEKRNFMIHMEFGIESYDIHFQFSEDWSYFETYKIHTDPQLKHLEAFSFVRAHQDGTIFLKMSDDFWERIKNQNFVFMANNLTVISLNDRFWNSIQYLRKNI